MSSGPALAARIRASLEEVEQVVQRAAAVGEKAVTTGDTGYWDGVALNLHGFYTGIERIFEDVARTLDGGVPSGPEWHQRLLMQMAAPVNGMRKAVISPETRRRLDQYRGFRHLVRNVYAYSLRPDRIRELLDELESSFGQVETELLQFAAALEEAG